MKFVTRIFQIIKTLLLCALFAAVLPYSLTKIYDFQTPKPFSGNTWHNPYQHLPKNFIKGNFHAHSTCWAGFTNGKNPSNEVQDYFVKNGYDVAVLSNYMKTTPNTTDKLLKIPAYEHGVNIRKVHQVAIGSEKVIGLDFPLLQIRSQKQQIINNIKANGSLVTIAHPHIRNAYTDEDLRTLTGYNFLEVFNHYEESVAEWDTALLAGKISYIMADDDSHEVDSNTTAKIYSRVFIPQKTAKDVLTAIKSGHHVGIRTYTQIINFDFNHILVSKNNLHYSFGRQIDSVRIIADGKIWKDKLPIKGKIDIEPIKHYLRFEIYGKNFKAFTNPIFRTNHNTLPTFTPNVNWLITYLYRMAVILLLITILFFVFKNLKSNK